MLRIRKEFYEEVGMNETAVIMVRALPCRTCNPGWDIRNVEWELSYMNL